MATAAEQLRELTEPHPDLPPIEALRGSLDAYLGWIELLLGTLFGALAAAGGAELIAP